MYFILCNDEFNKLTLSISIITHNLLFFISFLKFINHNQNKTLYPGSVMKHPTKLDAGYAEYFGTQLIN